MGARPPAIGAGTGGGSADADDRFPFLGVGTPAGWDDWFRFGVQPDGEALRLLADPVPTYRDATAVVGADDRIRVVDVDVDDCGLAYVLAASGDVYRYDPDRGSLRRLGCLWRGDPPGEPRAICVTRETIYVASLVPERGTDEDAGNGDGDGDGEPADDRVTGRVQALSRRVLATRWLATEPFVRPRRVVATGDAVYVLDDGPERAPGGAPAGFLARLGPGGRAVRVLEGLDATDVTVDDDGRLALLDVGDEGPAIRVYDPDAAGDDEGRDDGAGDGDGSDEGDGNGADGPTLPELDDERIPPAAFDATDGIPIEPSCLAVGAPTHAVVGAGPEFGGEQVLSRYVDRDGAFERLPAFARSCVRLVLSPEERSADRRPSDGSDGADGSGGPDEDGEGNATPTSDPGEDATPATGGDTPGIHATDDGDAADAAPASPRRLYAVDGRTRTLYVLRRATRNRTAPGGLGPYAGRVVGRLDAGEPGTVWHRVTTGLELGGPGTGVRLRYHATDDPDLALEGFRSVPDVGDTFADRLRDANVLGVAGLAALDAATVARVADAPTSRTGPWIEAARERVRSWDAVDHPTPTDVLLDDAVGRYLWVELTLLGEEFDGPRVETVRAYFPRRSYLRYLPAIYREDGASAAFLERFLSLFESGYVDVEEALAAFTRYLDPTGVPADYLTWLGGWLAVARDESWPTPARRTLLAEAPALFRQRGTEAGLRLVLDVLLEGVEPPVRDWETARAREERLLERWVDAGYLTEAERAAMREAHDALAARDRDADAPPYSVWTHAMLDCIDPGATALLAGYRRLVACPQCFLVLVRPWLSDEELRTVQRAVETWTPAHATGRAAALRRGVRLGGNSFIGVNTTLTEPSFVLGESLLGPETVLDDREPAQLGVSRFGGDVRMS